MLIKCPAEANFLFVFISKNAIIVKIKFLNIIHNPNSLCTALPKQPQSIFNPIIVPKIENAKKQINNTNTKSNTLFSYNFRIISKAIIISNTGNRVEIISTGSSDNLNAAFSTSAVGSGSYIFNAPEKSRIPHTP